jgi:uncharacterized protein (TIGR02611 family)
MKLIKRTVIAVVGGTVLMIGIAMIVLPGPAIVVIPAGLAILALEFVWARRLLEKSREYIAKKFPSKAAAVNAATSSFPAQTNRTLNDKP